MEERRSQVQLIIAVSTVLSIMVGSVSLISFIQSAERRITTMEIRLENIKDSINLLKSQLLIMPTPKKDIAR